MKQKARRDVGASRRALSQSPFKRNSTMATLLYKYLHFNNGALCARADAQRLLHHPIGVRILANRRHLPPYWAITIAEISGIGGLADER